MSSGKKIHKQILPPPERPVVSSNDSPTERISHLSDINLQMLVEQMKSRVKDVLMGIPERDLLGLTVAVL